MQTAIAEEAAEHIGWRKIQGEWKCPLCTGNNKNLMKAFDSLTNE
jgi:rubredoxin